MNMKMLFFWVCTMAISPAVFAQAKETTAVEAAIEMLHKAMVDASRIELDAMVSDALSYGHSSGLVEDKPAFIEKIVSGKSDFVSITVSDQSIHVREKTAIVRHILNAKTNDGGVPGEVHLKILQVWQKEGKSWKLIARQAVKIA
jgi:ketosteroid isomerase-like protein